MPISRLVPELSLIEDSQLGQSGTSRLHGLLGLPHEASSGDIPVPKRRVLILYKATGCMDAGMEKTEFYTVSRAPLAPLRERQESDTTRTSRERVPDYSWRHTFVWLASKESKEETVLPLQYLQLSSTIARARKLARQRHLSEAAYVVGEAIDNMVRQGSAAAIDAFLASLDVSAELDIVLVSLLAATKAPSIRGMLPRRPEFRERVFEKCESRSDRDSLLSGL
jgi:hypothetical protein